MNYRVLFKDLLTSSVWQLPDKARLVWITMLALKNDDQVVEASLPGLADMAKVGIEDAQAAIDMLKAPDPVSRSKKHEGRRVEEVEGGWRIINGDRYDQKIRFGSRRSRRSPILWNMWTRSSVHAFPPAIFVNGHPPRPATLDSNDRTPARSAA